MEHPRTKIIATLGPSTKTEDMIRSLIKSGVNVFRLNFSHGTHEEHLEIIQRIEKIRDELKEAVAMMLDTKGYEVRVEPLPEKELKIQKDKIYLLGPKGDFHLRPSDVVHKIEPGMELFFDDGYLVAHCVGKDEDGVKISFKNERILKQNKNCHIPEAHLDIPEITEQDRKDILFGIKNGIDLIAASFVNSRANILAIKQLLLENGYEDVGVIAKIETLNSLNNYESILQEADGIMVARGDLGIEMKIEALPSVQKMLLQKAQEWNKFTIVATQMLESMIENPRPTRAEVSDVANAIFESASAVMLSGETAVGKYPLETVQQMRRIVVDAEKHIDFNLSFFEKSPKNHIDMNIAISYGAVGLSMHSNAKGIFTFSTTGRSASSISSLRPANPIFALTISKRTFHRMAIQWGVYPILGSYKNLEEGLNVASKIALEKGWVELGDLLVVTFGFPFHRPGTTNTIQLINIGEVLLRGVGLGDQIIEAPIVHNYPLNPIAPHVAKNNIVLLIDFQKRYLPILKYAAGVIFTGQQENGEEEKDFLEAMKGLNIPCIYRARGDLRAIHKGLFVTLDPLNGVILAKKHG
ncbi:MAG: pyruvate kinase [Chlamydiia bacterium]|jgi:pyruvate kinase